MFTRDPALRPALQTDYGNRLLARAIGSAVSSEWGMKFAEDSEALLDVVASLTESEVVFLDKFVKLNASVPDGSGNDQLLRIDKAGLQALSDGADPRLLLRLQAKGVIREVVGAFYGYSGGAYVPTALGIDLIRYLEAVEPLSQNE